MLLSVKVSCRGFNFLVRQSICPCPPAPPLFFFFEVTCFTSLTKSGVFRGGGGTGSTPYTAVFFFCLVCKCVRAYTRIVCLYSARFLEDIPFKKIQKNKKKNKGSMAINSFKKTMENNA